jgi:nucleoid-associated protein YgaU
MHYTLGMNGLLTEILSWSGMNLPEACATFRARVEALTDEEMRNFRRAIPKSTGEDIRKESVVLLGSLLRRVDLPTEEIIAFLSRRLTSRLTAEQYALLTESLFPGDKPIPNDVLFDITSYTYLDRRIMFRKAKEIIERLKEGMSPERVLQLLLLSFRDDVTKENLELTLLVLSSTGYGEAARFVKESLLQDYETYLERTRREAEREKKTTLVLRDSPDHASYYLDKYVRGATRGDRDLPESPTKPVKGRAASSRIKTGETGERTPGSPEGVTGGRSGAAPGPRQTERPTAKKAAPGYEERASPSRAAETPTRPENEITGTPTPEGEPVKSTRKNQFSFVSPRVLLIACGCAVLIAAVLLPVLLMERGDSSSPGTQHDGKKALTVDGTDAGNRRDSAGAEFSSEGPSSGGDSPADSSSMENSNEPSRQETPAEAAGETYTVREGDTLSDISERYYHDPGMYPTIADENLIGDPDLIYPDQVLSIPRYPPDIP